MVDFCLSLPMAERVLKRADLMGRMMQRLDVSTITAVRLESGASIYEARARCIACPAEAECRAWLEAGERTLPEFCPNARFFARCKTADIAAYAARNAPDAKAARDGDNA